jgi:hypothetical protein
MTGQYYVSLIVIEWEKLGIGFFKDESIGFLPVYETIDALRKEWPKAAYIRVTPCNEIELSKEGRSKAAP